MLTPERREELGRYVFGVWSSGMAKAFPHAPQKGWDDLTGIERQVLMDSASAVANAIVPEGLEIVTLEISGTAISIMRCSRDGDWLLHDAITRKYWRQGSGWCVGLAMSTLFPSPAAALSEYREHIEGRD